MVNHTTEICMKHGHIAIIDEIDSDLCDTTWHMSNHNGKGDRLGYVAHTENNKGVYRSVLLHRVILSRKPGRELLKGEMCDHIDGNTLNNTRENIRLATKEQNNQNRKRHKNNTSGYKGVYWSKHKRDWYAQIAVNGKKGIMLGHYPTPELAYEAYCKAAKALHGEFAKLE